MSSIDLDRAFAEFASTGSPERLGEVYDALAPELLRIAIHMTRGAAEAEDVLQATFVTAIERAGSFEKGRPVRPWLTGILAQHARASRRRAQRVPDPERTRTPDEMSPHDRAEQRELFETLDRVLLDLPEAFRPVLVLRLKHGLTAPEIAEALARPPGTVRSQLARGLEDVRCAMPASLAGAFVLFAAQPVRGLDAIRQAVLGHAAHHVPVATAVTTVAGVIALKKILALVVVIVVVWIGWRIHQREDVDVAPLSSARTETPALATVDRADILHGANLDSAPREERAPVATSAIPTTSAPARVEITATYARDARPASGEVVLARFDGEHLPYFDDHVAVTDANGRVVFESVPPGSVSVRMLQGGEVHGTAQAGETLMLHPAQPAGVLVEGEVVDSDGNAVRDASIWSSESAYPNRGEVVARVDAAGRFRLREVRNDRYIAALSRGRALSSLQAVHGAPGDVVHVTIVVDKAGAELRGRVLDDHGKPIARARIMAGDDVVRMDQPAADGGRTPGGAPVHAVTDAEGRYELEGVPLGSVVVQARAPGFATTKDSLLMTAGGTEHDVVLVPEAIVSGTVRDADDAPVSAAVISSGGWMEFAVSRAWSDSSGRFTLKGLRAGPNDIVVNGRDQLRLQSRLDLVVGEMRTWDPRFEAPDPGWGHIHGVVRDEHGAPKALWGVSAEREEATNHMGIFGATDTSGQFTLRVEVGVSYRISVRAPGEEGQFPRAIRSGIMAGSGGLEFIVGADDPGLAIIRGTVVTSSGDPAADAQVTMFHAEARLWLKIPVDHRTGDFEIARVPPGKVDLEVRSTTLPCLVIGSRDVEAGARLDLGTIRMPAGAKVRGKLVGASEESLTDVELSISDARHMNVGQGMRHGRAWTSTALAAGKYKLSAQGRRIMDMQREFEITAGRDTEIDLDLRDAEPRPVRVEGVVAGPDAWATVAVVGADGKQTCMRSALLGPDGVLRMDVTVQPGAWKLVVVAGDERRAEAAFTHASGDSDEIVVRLPE